MDLDALLKQARENVFGGHTMRPAYYGDPDKMTEKQIRETIKTQDDAAIMREFMRLVEDYPRQFVLKALHQSDAAEDGWKK